MSKPPHQQPGHMNREAISQLRRVNLRPTRQRIAIFVWLFRSRQSQHVTAEGLHRKLSQQHTALSIATVYNTLNTFVEYGLLKKIYLNSDTAFYDTNTEPHHHIVIGDPLEIQDIPVEAIALASQPQLPEGLQLRAVDVILRAERRS